MLVSFLPRAFPVFFLALGCSLFTIAEFSGAAAQTNDARSAVAAVKSLEARPQPVGRKGAMSEVFWSTAPSENLYEMRLLKTAREIESIPGAMRNTKVWMARADICSTPGDEILMQIRSPLTCGTLGCEMVVLSDAVGPPRVLMRTIGDSIDAPAMDQLTINSGSTRQRSWKYDRGQFQQLQRR